MCGPSCGDLDSPPSRHNMSLLAIIELVIMGVVGIMCLIELVDIISSRCFDCHWSCFDSYWSFLQCQSRSNQNWYSLLLHRNYYQYCYYCLGYLKKRRKRQVILQYLLYYFTCIPCLDFMETIWSSLNKFIILF